MFARARTLPDGLADRFRGQVRDVRLEMARVALERRLHDPDSFALVSQLQPEELDQLLAQMAEVAGFRQPEDVMDRAFERWQQERRAARPTLESVDGSGSGPAPTSVSAEREPELGD
jgi:hypothetical protein